MKKTILIFAVMLVSIFFVEVQWTFAAEWSVTIQTTVEVPGANCTPADEAGIWNCRIWKWFTPVMLMIGRLIKYFTYLVALSAVLFIVINGILYSMAWINDSLKTGAKERITKTLLGLVILLLSWVILNAVAPWVYTL